MESLDPVACKEVCHIRQVVSNFPRFRYIWSFFYPKNADFDRFRSSYGFCDGTSVFPMKNKPYPDQVPRSQCLETSIPERRSTKAVKFAQFDQFGRLEREMKIKWCHLRCDDLYMYKHAWEDVSRNKKSKYEKIPRRRQLKQHNIDTTCRIFDC